MSVCVYMCVLVLTTKICILRVRTVKGPFEGSDLLLRLELKLGLGQSG